MFKKIERFFWFCSGAAANILEKCPSEMNKYFGIGATVFFTGVFAFFSGGYALYTVFHSSFPAILFGLVWGGMIFNLDRYIVSSLKKKGDLKKELRLAIPRLILAVFLATVISKPLELKIFESEIDAELLLMQQELFKEQEDQVKTRYQAKISVLKKEIERNTMQIREKERIRDELVLVAQKEADGTGGSGHRSMGPIYQAKKRDADKADQELQNLKERVEPLIQLKQKELLATEDELENEIQNLNRKNYDGLAARMEALSRISLKSTTIHYTNWFIFLLFIVIETAPLFVKLISERGPYDEMLELYEYKYKTHRKKEMEKLDQAPEINLTLIEGEKERKL